VSEPQPLEDALRMTLQMMYSLLEKPALMNGFLVEANLASADL